jgi:hypothetical protein
MKDGPGDKKMVKNPQEGLQGGTIPLSDGCALLPGKLACNGGTE